jgi:hypothetical protein
MLAALVYLAHFGCAHAADEWTVQTFDANGVKISYFV